jgi:hypothetical protein
LSKYLGRALSGLRIVILSGCSSSIYNCSYVGYCFVAKVGEEYFACGLMAVENRCALQSGGEKELDKNQKVGGCAGSDRTEALGCQRIVWAVHTESTNSTERGLVQQDIGQKFRSYGIRGRGPSYHSLSASAKRPGGFVLPPESPL